MEAFQFQRQLLPADLYVMKSIAAKLRATIGLDSAKVRCFCAIPAPSTTTTLEETRCPSTKKSVLRSNGRARAKVSNSQLKENWLGSLSCPLPELTNGEVSNFLRSDSEPQLVIGIDPDVSGALALLRTDDLGCSAQVFDSPHLKVLVNGRTRRRLDAKSIVELLKKFDAPVGTTAYLEQSLPYPQDGKQGWWGGGFGFGLWIGILVASGFSVVPVPALRWKNEFNLSGNRSNKEDSREVASTLFPSMSTLLSRKKDHGRAEALLIAAYGIRLKTRTNSSCIFEELTS